MRRAARSAEIVQHQGSAPSWLEPAQHAPGPVEGLRTAIQRLASSQIREVANAGIGRDDLIPLWFGEPDVPTPAFICEAASRALATGDTFYQPNAGIPELRRTLADYMNRLYGTALTASNVIVSASAMNALMLVMQALVDPDDEVVTTTPAWPNLPAVPQVLSGRIHAVPLQRRAMPAGGSTSTGCSRPAARAPGSSSSTRPTTRPAGR